MSTFIAKSIIYTLGILGVWFLFTQFIHAAQAHDNHPVGMASHQVAEDSYEVYSFRKGFVMQCETVKGDLHRWLTENYDESLVGRAVDAKGHQFEFYTNLDEDTYSMVITPIGKTSCVFWSGTGLDFSGPIEPVSPPVPTEGL